MTTYAIDGSEHLTSAEFIKLYSSKLEEILEDPNAHILLTDFPGCGIFLARYLKGHFYRNAVLYHVGNNPSINIANLLTKGNFVTREECRAQMINDSDECVIFER